MNGKRLRIRPGGALEGALFSGFLRHLCEVRELKPGKRLGPWRIIRELGRGGSGVVYLAERADGSFAQEVALKWLHGDRPVIGGRQALERERELLAGLDHPNIARLIDGGHTDDGMLWFAMDYVPGERIDDHARGLTVRERVELIRILCRAAHYAHSRGLIHGDIKPANVLVDDRGEPRLLDFGIARLDGADGADGGGYGLTPDFASPEQRDGEALTTTSDIWQLGHLLEMLLREQTVPADISAIIAKATAEEPGGRYESAAALESDLVAWQQRRPVMARSGGAGYRLTSFFRRHRALALLAMGAFFIIAAGGGWFTWLLAQERDSARMETERAEVALAEAESALARAESLREFLMDIFWAADPKRPRSELPSAEELLARGAKRALDEQAAPPVERLGMLAVVGEIYTRLGDHSAAAPILDAAIELGDRYRDEYPQDIAAVLHSKGWNVLEGAGTLDGAASLWKEAEALVSNLDHHWNLYAEIRGSRSFVKRLQGDDHAALQIVEPLYDEMLTRDDVDEMTQAHIMNYLASHYEAVGEIQAGYEVREAVIELSRRLEGGDSRNFAINLSNSVSLGYNLGKFDSAEYRARTAIDILDEIFDGHTGVLGATQGRLAFSMVYAGRFEEAMESMEAMIRTFAHVHSVDFDQWDMPRLYLGIMLGLTRQWDEAEPILDQTRELYSRAHHTIVNATSIEGMLAMALCRQNRVEEGWSILTDLERTENESFVGNPVRRAQLHEASAVCLFNADRAESALDEITRSLEAVSYPGRAMEIADRKILQARILASLDRTDQALEALDQAESAYLEIDLEDHPRFHRVESTRSELRGR